MVRHPMETLLKLLLEHPEAFTRSEVPCCLWSFIDFTVLEPRVSPAATALLFPVCARAPKLMPVVD